MVGRRTNIFAARAQKKKKKITWDSKTFCDHLIHFINTYTDVVLLLYSQSLILRLTRYLSRSAALNRS